MDVLENPAELILKKRTSRIDDRDRLLSAFAEELIQGAEKRFRLSEPRGG